MRVARARVHACKLAWRRPLPGGRGESQQSTAQGFQQEVLGRTAAFVGVGSSMFSTTVHWIRTARFGHATDTTAFL